MQKKIIGIFLCMLVIVTAVGSATERMSIGNTMMNDPGDSQPLITKIGHLSVPAAAFIPMSDAISYDNVGIWISGEGDFVAPVYLPHMATVTQFKFYWNDISSAKNGDAFLLRYQTGYNDFEIMAETHTSGSDGYDSSVDNTIDLAEINNVQYSYFIGLSLNNDIFAQNILIEYTYKAGLSVDEMTKNQQTQIQQIPLSC